MSNADTRAPKRKSRRNVSAKAPSPVRLLPPLQDAVVPPPPQWAYQTQLMKMIPRTDGRTLGVIIQEVGFDPRWQVLSVETAAPSGGTIEREVQAVFDDHAHKVVGRYASLVLALAAADSFAEAWMKKHKSAHHPSCTCGEIES